MLEEVPRSAFHPLTARDASLFVGLRRRFGGQRHGGWLGELREMEEQVGLLGVTLGRGRRERGVQSLRAM